MRFAVCHKDREHYAKDLCRQCYNAARASILPKRVRKAAPKGSSMDKATKERVKNSALIRKYGITLKQYLEMKAKQKNRCAICNKVRSLNVDHHHDSNTVRGLLCGTCNRGIGSLQECTDILMAAVKYLLYWANKYKDKKHV